MRARSWAALRIAPLPARLLSWPSPAAAWGSRVRERPLMRRRGGDQSDGAGPVAGTVLRHDAAAGVVRRREVHAERERVRRRAVPAEMPDALLGLGDRRD